MLLDKPNNKMGVGGWIYFALTYLQTILVLLLHISLTIVTQ